MRNGNITSFFQKLSSTPSSQAESGPSSQAKSPSASSLPVPVPAPQPTMTTRPRSSTPPPAISSPTLPPDLLSSSPPGPRERMPIPRNAEIMGSDDEDEDEESSEDEFPSLMPINKPSNTCQTPRAKRINTDFLSSPLTINTKSHFSMAELVAGFNKADAAIAITNNSLAEGSDSDPELPVPARTDQSPSKGAMLKHMMRVLPTTEDSDEDNGRADKLLRAVERTEAASSQKQWHFFEKDEDRASSISVQTPFPKEAAKGSWKFLASSRTRAAYFEDGMVFDLQSVKHNLPDEIVIWILNRFPYEESSRLRMEYAKLLEACKDQVYNVVDETAIESLLRGVGATKEAINPTEKIIGTHSSSRNEAQKDWSKARAVIRLLGDMSQLMNIQSLTRATLLLLRLGIDKTVHNNLAVHADYEYAMYWLVRSVPDSMWDAYCEDLCASLSNTVEDTIFRWDCLSIIPTTDARLVELRRRLTLVFLFGDLQRGSSHPEASFSIRAVIDRLKDEDFVINRNKTDYRKLLALVLMLNIAIDNGFPPAKGSAPQAVESFNADVDELANKFQHMASIIPNASGQHLPNMEARVALLDLEMTLLHSVRTRPRPRDDVFGTRVNPQDADLARRQDLMKRFFTKAN